jgi:hypothetical protein
MDAYDLVVIGALGKTHDPGIGDHLSTLCGREDGGDADRCLPDPLCLHRLRHDAAAEARGLLRVLLLWLGAVSADPGGAFGPRRRGILLRELGNRYGPVPTQLGEFGNRPIGSQAVQPVAILIEGRE